MEILSECVEELIDYLFIVFDKTIITFLLEKANKGIMENEQKANNEEY